MRRESTCSARVAVNSWRCGVQVVVVRLAAPHVTAAITSFDELPEREQCLLGVHFMANRYVITFVDFPGDPHGDHLAGIMQAYMPQAYPVCNTLQSVMQVRCQPNRMSSFPLDGRWIPTLCVQQSCCCAA